jgi:hypothetical protein
MVQIFWHIESFKICYQSCSVGHEGDEAQAQVCHHEQHFVDFGEVAGVLAVPGSWQVRQDHKTYYDRNLRFL